MGIVSERVVFDSPETGKRGRRWRVFVFFSRTFCATIGGFVRGFKFLVAWLLDLENLEAGGGRRRHLRRRQGWRLENFSCAPDLLEMVNFGHRSFKVCKLNPELSKSFKSFIYLILISKIIILISKIVFNYLLIQK